MILLTLLLTAAVGLLAALVMFCGDMLLYFTKGPYEMDGTLAPYAGIMKGVSDLRLRLGGLLGPVAAFGYCIGFCHLALSVDAGVQVLGWVATLLLSLGIIIGGAYHAQFAYIGMAAKRDDDAMLKGVLANVQFLSAVSMIPIALGCVLFSVLMVLGRTRYPAWAVVFTPTVMIFGQFLVVRLPQPLRVVFFGGWNNLVFVIFFAMSLLSL